MTSTLDKKKMPRETMLAKVEDVLKGGRSTDPPAYTLVLGAGASFGVVPTAKEMLGFQDPRTKNVSPKSIPVWLASQRDGNAKLETDEERFECVRKFWKKFVADNSAHDKCKNLRIDANGVPKATSISDGYQSVFETACVGGLDTPEKHRNYMRAVTMAVSDSTQLNATHFYLASLLSLQRRPDEVGSDKKPVYTGRREFARTIFTTNFDPLLQTSLQLFQLLYYMTDRPEILSSDALQTDQHPAIHLFYAHGSVHRPYMANTDDQIALLKRQNARDLAAYLGNHGVIVLGYSGWDDCLLEALNQTKTFSNNLYWLARSADSITEQVSNFLATHPNAYWVQIDDGDNFMAELHSRLCPGAPNTVMLFNPIRAVLSQLTSVKLAGIQGGRRSIVQDSDKAVSASGAPSDVETIRLQVVARLKDAQKLFTEPSSTGGDWNELERQANLSYVNKDWDAALIGYNRLLKEHDLPVEQKARSLVRHGYVSAQKGDIKTAIADYSAVIDLPGAPVRDLALARFNRAFHYGEQNKIGEAIADYSAIIDLPGAPVEEVASARYNRGVVYGEQGEREKAIADYSALIELSGAPTEDVAKALYNRGVQHDEKGNKNEAMADYSAVIDVPGAPIEALVRARYNRGNKYAEQGNQGKAITDYTFVIELPAASPEYVAKALWRRGIQFAEQADKDKAIADYSAVLKLPNAPANIIKLATDGLAAISLPDAKTTVGESKTNPG